MLYLRHGTKEDAADNRDVLTTSLFSELKTDNAKVLRCALIERLLKEKHKWKVYALSRVKVNDSYVERDFGTTVS